MNNFLGLIGTIQGVSEMFTQQNTNVSDVEEYVDDDREVAKLCVLIGINYTGTMNQLNGCINDTKNIKKMLIQQGHFKEEEIVMMNDFKLDYLYPSKKNILLKFDEMVNFAKKNEELGKKVRMFFSYSGHGYYQYDTNGDEEDGFDEVLCPIDCDWTGYISDDIIKQNLIDRLGENTDLVMLIDACHSGTSVDLKYNYKSNGFAQTNIKDSLCNVVMISGCRDDQTSADAYIEDPSTNSYQFQGAMTASFLANYEKNTSYSKLIKNMRKWLIGYEQIPQLSSGKNINPDGTYLLSYY